MKKLFFIPCALFLLSYSTLCAQDKPQKEYIYQTFKDTRVINFMEAAGMHPKTLERMDEKDHVLMVRTSGEFLNRVTSIGEIIIRDHFKALCDRIFKPADMGGIAGGTKYIVDGLLFKFANPAEGPYLGSYELANKATGHDLRCVLCSACC